MDNTQLEKAPPVSKNRRPALLAAAAFVLGAAVALAGFTLSSAMGNGNAVVTVNGEPITREAFYQRLEEEAGEEVLDQMISELLIAQTADRYDDVKVTDEEIAGEIEAIKRSYGTEEGFNDALARFNISLDRLSHEIKLSLIVDKLTRRGVEVTDEEIREYFEANRENLGRPEQVQVRHILVDTEEEAKALLARLKEGADFEELAAAHSTDTGTAANGGLVGYIHAGSPIVPSFKEAALKLGAGEISDPVKSDFGWHLIRVDERIAAKEATLQESEALIREQLMSMKARPVSDVISELRAGAKVDVYWPRYDFLANDPGAAENGGAEAGGETDALQSAEGNGE